MAKKEKDARDRAYQERLEAEEILEQFNKSADCTDIKRGAELADKVMKARKKEQATDQVYKEALEREAKGGKQE